jgi:hypothetical protein
MRPNQQGDAPKVLGSARCNPATGGAIATTPSFQGSRKSPLTGLTFVSSTAFVMQLLQEKGEVASRHGSTAFAILFTQTSPSSLLALYRCFPESRALPATSRSRSRRSQSSVLFLVGVLPLRGAIRPTLARWKLKHSC